jgi:S1-C subfamily serine protease
MRVFYVICVCLFICASTEPASAQGEAWLGVGVTSGGEVKWDLEKGGKTTMSAQAKVIRVDQTGPAAAAGIKLGDVILTLDGSLIRDGKELAAAIGLKQPGATVRLRIRRDDGVHELNVLLGQRPPR